MINTGVDINKNKFLGGSQDQLRWYSDGPANVKMVLQRPIEHNTDSDIDKKKILALTDAFFSNPR